MKQNTRRFSITFGIFALLLAITGIVYAQSRPGGMMGGMMSMMQNCPMMGSVQQGPASALEHRQELGLTEDQVQKLEALQENMEQAQMPAMQRMQALHQQIADATEGASFDEAAARDAFERMGEVHTEMGLAMLRATHETREVLTPEQRATLSTLSGGMMGMHGMMQNCPMMSRTAGMSMQDCPMMQGMMNR